MSAIGAAALAGAIFLSLTPHAAWAWGSEGHQVVALIAERFLLPDTRRTVEAMLHSDSSNLLTQHDIAQEANWADRLRDDGSEARRDTRKWHFVDLELSGPNLGNACFGRPALLDNLNASHGPPNDCIVDKVNQFAFELHNPATPGPERLAAIKFLLHFVGDLHQPLHAADDHDRGGNAKHVLLPDGRRSNLHGFWDTASVAALGTDPQVVAREIETSITPEEARGWQAGTPSTWAMESFELARSDTYGKLPPPDANGSFTLSRDYVQMAQRDVKVQLARAGVRLASILNKMPSAASLATKPITQISMKTQKAESGLPLNEASCRGDQVVWVNLRSGVYHFTGDGFFGQTRSGSFECERDAIAQGAHASHGMR